MPFFLAITKREKGKLVINGKKLHSYTEHYQKHKASNKRRKLFSADTFSLDLIDQWNISNDDGTYVSLKQVFLCVSYNTITHF